MEQDRKVLEGLAEAEYGATIEDILTDVSRPQDERLWRLGRLIGITVKEPFAHPADIGTGVSLTGARRRWELDAEKLENPRRDEWQYAVLSGLLRDRDLRRDVYLGPTPDQVAYGIVYRWNLASGEFGVPQLAQLIEDGLHVGTEAATRSAEHAFDRSGGLAPTENDLVTWLWDDLSQELQSPWHVAVALEEMQSERGLFRCLAKSARKYLCGDPSFRAKVEESSKAAGLTASALSPQALIAGSSVELVNEISQRVPWLPPTGSALALGICIIIGNVGLDGFCMWVTEYVETKSEAPDIET